MVNEDDVFSDLAQFTEPEQVTPAHYKKMWKHSRDAWSCNRPDCFATAECFPAYMPDGTEVSSTIHMQYFIEGGVHYRRPRSVTQHVEDISRLQMRDGPPRLSIWDIVRMGRK